MQPPANTAMATQPVLFRLYFAALIHRSFSAGFLAAEKPADEKEESGSARGGGRSKSAASGRGAKKAPAAAVKYTPLESQVIAIKVLLDCRPCCVHATLLCAVMMVIAVFTTESQSGRDFVRGSGLQVPVFRQRCRGG
jgi:hypothetical protein